MSIQQILIWIAVILAAFFCGGIMFSRIIPKLICNTDISSVSPDGNPGAANVFKYCGIKVGITCLFLDMLKGFLPVYTAQKIFGYDDFLFFLVITAPVLGHAVSPYDKNKGGKCIATSFGVLLALFPANKISLVLAAIYIFFSVIVKIDSHRIRSIVTFSVFSAVSCPLLIYIHKPGLALGCFAVSAITVIKHIKPTEAFQPQQVPEQF